MTLFIKKDAFLISEKRPIVEDWISVSPNAPKSGFFIEFETEEIFCVLKRSLVTFFPKILLPNFTLQ